MNNFVLNLKNSEYNLFKVWLWFNYNEISKIIFQTILKALYRIQDNALSWFKFFVNVLHSVANKQKRSEVQISYNIWLTFSVDEKANKIDMDAWSVILSICTEPV